MEPEAQKQLEEERMQEELDCLKVVHTHGLEGTAARLAAHLGLSKEFKQMTGDRNAAHK